jgi:hypothetical protein
LSQDVKAKPDSDLVAAVRVRGRKETPEIIPSPEVDACALKFRKFGRSAVGVFGVSTSRLVGKPPARSKVGQIYRGRGFAKLSRAGRVNCSRALSSSFLLTINIASTLSAATDNV